MQNDNELKTYYLGIYQDFKKSEAYAKKLVRSALPFEKEVEDLIKEARQIRKELHKIFTHPVLYEICNKCHKEPSGGCCQLYTDCPHMPWQDFVYIIAENPKFELPHPDIKFLTSLKKLGCLFLGQKGCLLKEERAILCFEGTCFRLDLGKKRLLGDKTLQEGQVVDLTDSLNKKTRLLFAHILSKNKAYSSGNFVIDYGLLRVI